MTDLFKLLKTEQANRAKFQKAVSAAVEGKDYKSIVACAEAVEAAFPVKKVDGKDANRDERNGYLSSLRMALMRAGRGLKVPVKLTIKKIEGVWQVVEGEVDPADEASAAAQQGAADAAGKASQLDPDSPEADVVWGAVDIVLKHLSNPAVLTAIRSGLEKLAAK